MVKHSAMYLPFILLATIFSVQGKFSLDSLFSREMVPALIDAVATVLDQNRESPTPYEHRESMNAMAKDVYLAETIFNTVGMMCPEASDGKLSGLVRESLDKFHTSWREYNSANVTAKKETRKSSGPEVDKRDKDIDGVAPVLGVTEKFKTSRQDLCSGVKKVFA